MSINSNIVTKKIFITKNRHSQRKKASKLHPSLVAHTRILAFVQKLVVTLLPKQLTNQLTLVPKRKPTSSVFQFASEDPHPTCGLVRTIVSSIQVLALNPIKKPYIQTSRSLIKILKLCYPV